MHSHDDRKLNIDEFISRTESLASAKNNASKMLDNVDISDTLVVAHAHRNETGDGGMLHVIVHGCSCGIRHVITQLAKENGISLVELALEEVFTRFKNNDDEPV